jgi:hypothetical protein
MVEEVLTVMKINLLHVMFPVQEHLQLGFFTTIERVIEHHLDHIAVDPYYPKRQSILEGVEVAA